MNTLTYTSFRENFANALEHVEKGETKTVKFVSKDKFNASLKPVQKTHAKNIQALADR